MDIYRPDCHNIHTTYRTSNPEWDAHRFQLLRGHTGPKIDEATALPRSSIPSRKKRRRADEHPPPPAASSYNPSANTEELSSVALDEDDSLMESAQILGPAGAHDAYFLERALNFSGDQMSKVSTPFRVYSSDPRNPVVHSPMARHHDIYQVAADTSRDPANISEKLVGHCSTELLQLYVGDFFNLKCDKFQV
ncbi:hypothetical protein TSTA_048410 [Talaromyces stipitatus ATCC 10500]|uniref:Uncharacterized protein n=1 Tax=Talaromyces stipitatus (strain ATCC 10500 / CBS 375.48 / QM 6759 / NRRL 1006) TaxID=441959 RepID=B8MKY4_TALSN|nr:uncharacterized protein TSTA_048410 [Talaromyces stipitatus ATCC 10500]EED15400.1 hypothetical protein TSTA_048410 [Talaromyces stipitatus ATCC 10500]